MSGLGWKAPIRMRKWIFIEMGRKCQKMLLHKNEIQDVLEERLQMFWTHFFV